MQEEHDAAHLEDLLDRDEDREAHQLPAADRRVVGAGRLQRNRRYASPTMATTIAAGTTYRFRKMPPATSTRRAQANGTSRNAPQCS